MDGGSEWSTNRPAMARREVHVSNRYPVLFFILMAVLMLASIYVEGVSERWWN